MARKITLTAARRGELLAAARAVRLNSYSPYSNYKVGAALLAASGKIYVGANFENAAYGAGTCAERVALGAALAAGEREFVAVCVCGADNTVSPCGICRQALSEFGDMTVLCIGAEGSTAANAIRELKLSALLPESFGPANLA